MSVKTQLTDGEVINSLKSGQGRETAIRFLYDDYFESLSNYVMNNNGNAADAEDIFQEVLVNFISLVQLDKFRGESSIKTFLFSMNKFKWLNELKKRNSALKRNTGFEKIKDTIAFDNNVLIIEQDATNHISKLLEQLGEQCKKILVLFYYDNLSMKDILLQMNYENEQVVRNKKYKCLKQLSNMIHEKPSLYSTLKHLFNG